MDPVTFTIMAFSMYLFQMMIRYGVETLLPQDNTKAVSAGEDYDRRWGNPKYINMTHKTISLEKETLGYSLTVCECKACRTPPEMVRMPVTKGNVIALPEPRRAGSPCEYRGCEYRVTGDNYYCHKHGTKNNGDFNDYYEMYVDQRSKPIGSWTAEGDDKPDTHIIFTRSGPKSLSKRELDQKMRDTVKKDRERRRDEEIKHERENYINYDRARDRYKEQIEKSLNKNLVPVLYGDRREAPRLKMEKVKK